MDALRHAEEILATLRRQHPEFAVPGNVGSPMDDRVTVTLPRAFIEGCEPGATHAAASAVELGRADGAGSTLRVSDTT